MDQVATDALEPDRDPTIGDALQTDGAPPPDGPLVRPMFGDQNSGRGSVATSRALVPARPCLDERGDLFGQGSDPDRLLARLVHTGDGTWSEWSGMTGASISY